AGIIFMQHPVLGEGFGTFRYNFHQYVPGITDDLDAHNLYLQTLAETGTIGFIVFFVSMWLFFLKGFKLIKSSDPFCVLLGVGLCRTMAANMEHGRVDYIFIVSAQFGNLFWLVLALCLVAGEQAEREARFSQPGIGKDSAASMGATA